MEATIRKPTQPNPVFAPPPKGDSSTVGDVIEDLIILNSYINSNSSENIDDTENRKRKLESEVANRSPNLKKTKKSELEQDLHLSEEDVKNPKCREAWKMTQITEVSPNKRKPVNNVTKNKNQKYKSAEFVISDDEDCNEDLSLVEQSVAKIHATKENYARKLKFTSPKPMNNLQRCRYLFKNHPRKGERCDLRTKEVYCPTHKKIMISQSNSAKVSATKLIPSDNFGKEIKTLNMGRENEDSKTHEKINKLEKEIEDLKKIVRGCQTNIQELNNKISYLLAQDKTGLPAVAAVSKKIHKLDREKTYTLTQYIGEEGIFKSGTDIFKIKIPRGMNKPENMGSQQLKFNPESSKFEWI